MKRFLYLLWVTALGLYLPGNLFLYKQMIPFLMPGCKGGVHQPVHKIKASKHRHPRRTNPDFVRAHNRESLDKGPVSFGLTFLTLFSRPSPCPDSTLTHQYSADIFHPPC